MSGDVKVDMLPGVNPFGVPCPRCGVPADELCIDVTSATKAEKRFPHPMRVDEARKAAGR